MSFDTIPSKATLKPSPFKAHVSDEELDYFQKLLSLSKIGPKTYENLKDGDNSSLRYLGISRKWLEGAKEHWVNNYNWYDSFRSRGNQC